MMWKLISVRLEIVLISTQDRCTVCAECTIGSEIALGTPNGTVVDVGLVEAHLSPFGDSVSLNVRRVHGGRFGPTRWNS